MGYIVLNKITFSPASSSAQTVRVEYRLASSSGGFTLVSNSAPVLANGNFNPAVTINELTDGETYTVKVTNLCNGSTITQNIVAGVECTSYTVEAMIGGATVEWSDCQSGATLSTFIGTAQQLTICTRTQSHYFTSTGQVTEVLNNGTCQS